MKLNDLLAKMPGYMDEFHKLAGIEQADQKQQEIDFGRIAYNFLVDRASSLIPHLIGFEVVERKEEGSRCVGMFGFKIGQDFYYVPVFFINNQIKGMDSIFSKSTNMFMPLTEAWTSFIGNKNVMELGKEVGNDPRRTLEIPNMNFLRQPEYYPKSASINEIIGGGSKMFEYLQDHVSLSLEKDAEFQLALGGALAKMAKENLDDYGTDTTLVDFLKSKGGPDATIELLNKLSSDVKLANAFLSFYPGLEVLDIADYTTKVAAAKSAAKLQIIESDKCDCGICSEEERPKLIRDSFVIQDYREPAEQSELYDVDYVKRFSNPSKSGKYNVLLRNGGTAACYVVMPKVDRREATVILPDGSGYVNEHPHRIYVRGEEITDGDIYAAGVPVDAMEVGGTYMLLDKEGSGFGPVRIDAVESVDGDRATVRVWDRSSWTDGALPDDERDFKTMKIPNTERDHDRLEVRYLQLAKHNSDKLIIKSETLIVPANWKGFKLTDSYSSESKLCLGTLNDVTEAMFKAGAYTMSVEHKSGEYFLRLADLQSSKPLDYKTACYALVGQFGLTVPDTEELLKSAAAQDKVSRLIKFSQMVGVTPAAVPDLQSLGLNGYDTFMNVPLQTPYEAEYTSQMNGVMPVLPNINNPQRAMGGQSEQDLMNAGQLAQMAASGGQKQVFDHAAIAGLSKVYNTGSILDTYVPDMLKTLDRLGRILFLFYWKNEDFAERYGADSLSEMEDTLKGTFESLGDLTLKLRQKNVSNNDMVMPLE